jgi:hypothetical protein
MPLFPLLLQILFLALVTSEGPYLVILAERRSGLGWLSAALQRILKKRAGFSTAPYRLHNA